MRTVQRLAALAGGAVLMAAGLTTFTAAPAEAATICSKGYGKVTDWGKVATGICKRSYSDGRTYIQITGTVTDRKTDGCDVRYRFTTSGGGLIQSHKYTTGDSLQFNTGYIGATTASNHTLTKIC